MDVRLRRVEPGDLYYIVELEEKAFGPDAFSLDYLFYLYNRCRDYFFVADYKGLVVGYIVSCREGSQLHVHSVAVVEELRGRGIGRKLLEETIRVARENGLKAVYLEVKTTNTPALRLYEKLGFKRIGVKEKYYNDGSDAYLYALSLEENTPGSLQG